mmetsp:Transcript_2746/g.4312  ORF Transcript_2746/g.4312 Transcript_2746/m.4312 type:complete len:86 (+) Transcript_2746:2114-2371(+)
MDKQPGKILILVQLVGKHRQRDNKQAKRFQQEVENFYGDCGFLRPYLKGGMRKMGDPLSIFTPEKDADKIVLSVFDNGVGIKDED